MEKKIENVEKSRMRRNDLILLLVLFAAAAVVFSGWKLAHKTPGDVLVIEVNGEVSAVYPLSEDGVYEVEGVYGRKNTLTVKDGAAHMSASDCPDHLCEAQGYIGKNGETIVCLPNRVIARVEGAADSDADIQIR